MIRAADLMPLPPGGPATAATGPVPSAGEGGGGVLNPSSWFDGDAFSADTRIGVALGSASRGLSVAQHAERVLGHLCGEAGAERCGALRDPRGDLHGDLHGNLHGNLHGDSHGHLLGDLGGGPPRRA